MTHAMPKLLALLLAAAALGACAVYPDGGPRGYGYYHRPPPPPLAWHGPGWSRAWAPHDRYAYGRPWRDDRRRRDWD